MALRFLNDGYFAGSVGIGTDSPSDKLDVQGAGGVGIRVSNSTNPGYYANLKLNYNDVSTMQLTCLGTSILQAGNTGNTVLASRTNKDILINPNGTGNVGINTTTPDEKLEVAGNIKITSALLSNQENTDIDSAAAEVVAQVSTTYTAAFFDFVVKKTTNVRSGTVYACHDGTNVEFTETSTNDLGDTSDVTLSVDKTSTDLRLIATVTSDGWSVKSLIRAI